MNRLLTLCAGLAFLTAARADETKPRLDPGQAPDVQDVVFLGKSRPVLLRLHILNDGKPFSQAWDDYVKKVFQFADADNNGFLDENECKRLPPATMMQQFVRGNIYGFYNLPAVKLAELDEDSDGKVSLDELKAYYTTKAQVAAIQMMPSYNYAQPGGNRLTTSLIHHLGGKDGKLELKKIVNADALVARLDANDDETIDANELNTLPADAANPVAMVPPPVMMPGQGGRRLQTGDSSFFLVPKETGSGKLTERLTLAKELINRYDKDKSGKLTREEIGLDLEAFRNLDRNGDGVLDAVELLRYFVVSPDVELTVHLGAGKRDKGDLSGIHPTPGKKGMLHTSVKQASVDTVTLALTSVQMEVRSAGGYGVYVQLPQQRQAYYDQLFNQADKGKKGWIDLQEDLKQPNVQYMKSMFEMADRNGDGRLMRKEFDDFMSLHAEALGTTTTLTVQETKNSLFDLLDENRDGRLSVRELRKAAEKLKAYDLNGDGFVTEDEVPIQVSLVVGAGSNPYPVMRNIYQPGYQGQRPASTAGPLWFRKMDRNGDGDVSRREFLGTKEQFKKLDLDGDGYISLEEAIKADAQLRKQTKKD